MSLSLGPPPIAAESSRAVREEKIDAGALLAEREQFMAKRARSTGLASADRGIWRSCASDKRGGAEGGAEGDATRRVTFATATDVRPSARTEPRAGSETRGQSKPHSRAGDEPFPWICALVAIVVVFVGASLAFCSWRRSHRMT